MSNNLENIFEVFQIKPTGAINMEDKGNVRTLHEQLLLEQLLIEIGSG